MYGRRPSIKLPGIDSIDALGRHVVTSGCYSEEENRRIFAKWFRSAPSTGFREASRRYGLDNYTLCDIGCGFGATLPFAPPGSFGLEISRYQIDFARSIGLEVHERDVLADSLDDLPRVDAVWTRDVLEHVDSPHVVLRKAWELLKPRGLLVVSVPVVPPFEWLRHLPRIGGHFSGHLHGDHVSAFTSKTLQFGCERAGFETLAMGPFLPGAWSVLDGIFRLMSTIVYVGRKREEWEYPAHSMRARANNHRGYVWKGASFPEDGESTAATPRIERKPTADPSRG